MEANSVCCCFLAYCRSGQERCSLLNSLPETFCTGAVHIERIVVSLKNYIYPFTSVSLLSRIWVGSFIPAIEVDTNAVGVCTFIILLLLSCCQSLQKLWLFFSALKGIFWIYGFLVRYWFEVLFQHILSVTYSISTGKAQVWSFGLEYPLRVQSGRFCRECAVCPKPLRWYRSQKGIQLAI